LCSGQLGKELVLPFFNIIATIVSVCVLLLWVMVASLTAVESWKGRMFYAPCLSVADRILENPVPDERVGNRLPVEEVSR
jgi:ABC-type proline/glycine betaine transport system permease subunit